MKLEFISKCGFEVVVGKYLCVFYMPALLGLYWLVILSICKPEYGATVLVTHRSIMPVKYLLRKCLLCLLLFSRLLNALNCLKIRISPYRALIAKIFVSAVIIVFFGRYMYDVI